MAKKRVKPTKNCVACGRAIHIQALICRCGAVQPRPQKNDRPEEQPASAEPMPTTDETMISESTPKPKRVSRSKKIELSAEQPAPADPTPTTDKIMTPEPTTKPKRASRSKKIEQSVEQPEVAEPTPDPVTVEAVVPEPPPKPKRASRPATPKRSELSAFIDAIEALGGLDAAREALDLLERAKRL